MSEYFLLTGEAVEWKRRAEELAGVLSEFILWCGPCLLCRRDNRNDETEAMVSCIVSGKHRPTVNGDPTERAKTLLSKFSYRGV